MTSGLTACPSTGMHSTSARSRAARRCGTTNGRRSRTPSRRCGSITRISSDYQTDENAEANRERKQKFFKWYRDNGLDETLDIPLASDHKLASLLGEYYTVEDEKISYDQFINRACFWMATGSGKTLVLVKLIEVLRGLIQRGEIPPHDILILSCRDDLIEQLKKHVHEFNAARSDLFIHLRELREYADAKRDNPSLFKDHELTVFYYRSDNLSDEQKERIIDFRNYDDGGKWYVLLDEAHKGDREDSKRQHIYSILSRNGFLFNFSATFTDARDLTTTVYNFNLSEFIKAGYGKHIAILQQELRAFRDEDDYSNEEKQKIVLKSLLMLAYARKVLREAAPSRFRSVPQAAVADTGQLRQHRGGRPATVLPRAGTDWQGRDQQSGMERCQGRALGGTENSSPA